MGYKVENGFLTHNGKKVFAIGQSYYPSFHKYKFPVPPEGDRIGEMKKDISKMKEVGFNHIRFAAIGNTRLENGGIIVDTPLVDKMIEEAAANDVSISVRLQGYTPNLRRRDDVRMVDNSGEGLDPNVWYNFIQSSMCDPNIIEDDRTLVKGLTEHYEKYENVVGYQIYNEPHYPREKVYDYSRFVCEEYKKWLVDKGILSIEESVNHEPPKVLTEDNKKEWILWRLFNQQVLSKYLCNSAKVSKAQYPEKTVYTCLTTDQMSVVNFKGGVDFYEVAEGMDIVGYTNYIAPFGDGYYLSSQYSDFACSVAKNAGKQCWNIELDARTKVPLDQFNKSTYITLGAGCKGIMYYQWRGDCPVEGVPNPNSCGFLNYDGTPTANYTNAVNMVKLINKLSDYLVSAERIDYGVAILWSDYANFNVSNITAGDIDCNKIVSKYAFDFHKVYKDLKRNHYTVDIIKAETLENADCKVKLLLVPNFELLGEDEKEAVKRFDKKAKVFEYYENTNESSTGYKLLSTKIVETTTFKPQYNAEDVLAFVEEPLVTADKFVGISVLKGEDYYVIVLVNPYVAGRKIKDINLRCRMEIGEAVFYTNTAEEKRLLCDGNKISIDEIVDGAIIIAKNKEKKL